MAVDKTKYTSQEFWDFVNRPENAEQVFERINGEIVEAMPSNPYSSAVAMRIGHFFMIYLMQNPIGHVTGEQGGYDISDEDTFAPDVAFIAKARQPHLPQDGFNPIPPDLVVEVVSPSDVNDPKQRIQKKLEKYRAAKIPLVWYVYTNPCEVKVYAYGQLIRTAGIDDMLDGGDVLPGFKLPVRDIFPE